jgi:predicted RNA methylase
MDIGDVVIPRDRQTTELACGCGRYNCAIVASIDPFVLVSVEGDMRWSATVLQEEFETLCQARVDITTRAVARWEYDKRQLRG